jgi:molybdate transport system regulatory protein
VFEIKAKIWLESDSKCVIGKGRAELLKKVKELGSLSEVAKSMNMAYSHAWSEIKEIEEVVGSPIIKTSRGGNNRGGSCLTEFGEEILKLFENEKKSLDSYISKRNKI